MSHHGGKRLHPTHDAVPVNDPSDDRLYPPIPAQSGPPGPWRVYASRSAPWHLYTPERLGDNVVATFYYEDDAVLVGWLSRYLRGIAGVVEGACALSPPPWLLRPEIDRISGTGWHIYSVAGGHHICVAQFRDRLDAAVTVTLINAMALLGSFPDAA